MQKEMEYVKNPIKEIKYIDYSNFRIKACDHRVGKNGVTNAHISSGISCIRQMFVVPSEKCNLNNLQIELNYDDVFDRPKNYQFSKSFDNIYLNEETFQCDNSDMSKPIQIRFELSEGENLYVNVIVGYQRSIKYDVSTGQFVK